MKPFALVACAAALSGCVSANPQIPVPVSAQLARICQFEPLAHAAFVVLNKDLGLPHGKCARVFGSLFGIPISRATSARSILRSAGLARAAYDQLRLDIRG